MPFSVHSHFETARFYHYCIVWQMSTKIKRLLNAQLFIEFIWKINGNFGSKICSLSPNPCWEHLTPAGNTWPLLGKSWEVRWIHYFLYFSTFFDIFRHFSTFFDIFDIFRHFNFLRTWLWNRDVCRTGSEFKQCILYIFPATWQKMCFFQI
jgi:hypothetical protein